MLTKIDVGRRRVSMVCLGMRSSYRANLWKTGAGREEALAEISGHFRNGRTIT